MIEEHEEQLTQAFKAFTRLERRLQQLVGEALGSYYGTQWAKYIPQSIREDCERKMAETEGESVAGEERPERQKGLVKHADFAQIMGIVDNQWEAISRYWPRDKQATMGRLEQIRQYRNALMHSALLPKDALPFAKLCDGLLEQIETAPKTVPSAVKPPEAIPSNLGSGDSVASSIPGSDEQRRFLQQTALILDQMSGLFEGERDALLSLVASRLRLASPSLLELIRQKFSRLPDTKDKVDALFNKLPPQRPSRPDPSWGLKSSKWLKWASESYIPYRYWMIVNEQVDDDLEELSIAYEDWLYASYAKLIERPEQFVVGTSDYIRQLLDKGQRVLWILVDDLPFFLRRVLAKLLEESGFTIQRIDRQFAMLPTETGVSRTSALTGKLPSDLSPVLSDKDAILQAWWGRASSSRVRVLDKLSDLEHIDQYEADLYIYVYSRLDKLFHAASSRDFEREEELESALARLISKLYGAMTKLSEKDPAVLVLSSDHGATFLSGRSSELPVPPSAIKDELYEEHGRFIRVSKPDGLNDVDWFFLDKNVFHLSHDYAVARGWRQINGRTRGFTHGGLSPEETVVPMFTCELGRSEFERLAPTYEQASSPLRPGRLGELIVRVRNPYRMSIEDLRITLTEYGDVLGPIGIEPQMEATTAPVEIRLPSKMTIEDDAVFVDILVEFTAGGLLRTQQAKLRLKVRQLFKTDLDDEFGAMF